MIATPPTSSGTVATSSRGRTTSWRDSQPSTSTTPGTTASQAVTAPANSQPGSGSPSVLRRLHHTTPRPAVDAAADVATTHPAAAVTSATVTATAPADSHHIAHQPSRSRRHAVTRSRASGTSAASTPAASGSVRSAIELRSTTTAYSVATAVTENATPATAKQNPIRRRPGRSRRTVAVVPYAVPAISHATSHQLPPSGSRPSWVMRITTTATPHATKHAATTPSTTLAARPHRPLALFHGVLSVPTVRRRTSRADGTRVPSSSRSGPGITGPRS